MKNKIPRATLVIWGIIVAIVIVMATVCIVLILQGKWGIDGNDSSDYIEIKEENNQQDISVIHLNWLSGDVQVKKSSNNQIRIVQKGSQDYPQEQLFSTKIDGDTLYIEDTRGYGINMFGFQKQENTDLVLYLPEKEYQQLNGNFVSANVTVDTCNTDHLYLKTISGTIFVEKGKCDSIELNTTSGDISVNHIKTDESLKMVSVSGAVIATESKVENDTYAYSASGNININDLHTKNMKCETISSSIQTEGIFDNVTFSTTYGLVECTANEPLNQLTVTTVSGDFHGMIPKENGFTATYHTVSGTFESEFETIQDNHMFIYGDKNGMFEFNTSSGSVTLSALPL